jgi:hypothetical protein
VTLLGNVVVTRGTDILRGQRLTVDLTSGVSKMDGGRVDGIFQAGPRNLPDPRSGPAEKGSAADKGSAAEKSAGAEKSSAAEKSGAAEKR